MGTNHSTIHMFSFNSSALPRSTLATQPDALLMPPSPLNPLYRIREPLRAKPTLTQATLDLIIGPAQSKGVSPAMTAIGSSGEVTGALVPWSELEQVQHFWVSEQKGGQLLIFAITPQHGILRLMLAVFTEKEQTPPEAGSGKQVPTKPERDSVGDKSVWSLLKGFVQGVVDGGAMLGKKAFETFGLDGKAVNVSVLAEWNVNQYVRKAKKGISNNIPTRIVIGTGSRSESEKQLDEEEEKQEENDEKKAEEKAREERKLTNERKMKRKEALERAMLQKEADIQTLHREEEERVNQNKAALEKLRENLKDITLQIDTHQKDASINDNIKSTTKKQQQLQVELKTIQKSIATLSETKIPHEEAPSEDEKDIMPKIDLTVFDKKLRNIERKIEQAQKQLKELDERRTVFEKEQQTVAEQLLKQKEDAQKRLEKINEDEKNESTQSLIEFDQPEPQKKKKRKNKGKANWTPTSVSPDTSGSNETEEEKKESQKLIEEEKKECQKIIEEADSQDIQRKNREEQYYSEFENEKQALMDAVEKLNCEKEEHIQKRQEEEDKMKKNEQEFQKTADEKKRRKEEQIKQREAEANKLKHDEEKMMEECRQLQKSLDSLAQQQTERAHLLNTLLSKQQALTEQLSQAEEKENNLVAMYELAVKKKTEAVDDIEESDSCVSHPSLISAPPSPSLNSPSPPLPPAVTLGNTPITPLQLCFHQTPTQQLRKPDWTENICTDTHFDSEYPFWRNRQFGMWNVKGEKEEGDEKEEKTKIPTQEEALEKMQQIVVSPTKETISSLCSHVLSASTERTQYGRSGISFLNDGEFGAIALEYSPFGRIIDPSLPTPPSAAVPTAIAESIQSTIVTEAPSFLAAFRTPQPLSSISSTSMSTQPKPATAESIDLSTSINQASATPLSPSSAYARLLPSPTQPQFVSLQQPTPVSPQEQQSRQTPPFASFMDMSLEDNHKDPDHEQQN